MHCLMCSCAPCMHATLADKGVEHVEVLQPDWAEVRNWMPPAEKFQGPFVADWNKRQETYRWTTAAEQATLKARATLAKPAQPRGPATSIGQVGLVRAEQQRPLVINFY